MTYKLVSKFNRSGYYLEKSIISKSKAKTVADKLSKEGYQVHIVPIRIKLAGLVVAHSYDIYIKR